MVYRRSLLAFVLAAAAGLALAAAAHADTPVGDWKLSGSAWAGYQGVSDDFRSAKFEQYRDESPGAGAGANFLLEDDEGQLFVRGWLDNLFGDNQEVDLRGGRYGRWRLSAGLSQFSQVFSNNARTPYIQLGSHNLVLPAAWNTPAAEADLEAELQAFSTNPTLQFRQRNWHGGLQIWASEDLLLSGGYQLRDRDGERPLTLQWGSPGGNFVNYRGPVDDDTHTWNGSALTLGDDWNLGFDYQGSHYDNDVRSVTIDKPIQNAAEVLGRVSGPPDNTAHVFSFSGSTTLPGEMGARVAGTVAYGLHRQDETFLPMSANGAATAPLTATDLDGEVDTILANLLFTARPRSALSVKVRYLFYDYDNDTDTIQFIDRARNDADAPSATPPDPAIQRDYRRQTASAEGTWRLSRTQKLTGDYEWSNWYREDREVSHSNDHSLGLTWDYRPRATTRLRARYEYSTRDGNRYDPLGSDPNARMYDMADRDRHKIDVLATLIPLDDLELTFTAGYSHSDYDNDRFGLDDRVSWTAGVDSAWWLCEGRLGLIGYYTFDRGRWKQTANSPSPWTGRSTDKAHDLGLAVATILRPERLSFRLGWEYHWGKAETRADNTLAGAVDYPSIKDNLQILSAMFDQRLRDHVRLEYGYRFERWNGTDFKYDDLGLTPPTSATDVTLSDNVDDYEAHIFIARVIYEF